MTFAPNEKRRLADVLPWLAVASLIAFVIFAVPPGTLPFPPGAAYSDAAIAHWPSAYFLRHSVWAEGRWPFWNPHRMLGVPFAANPLNKVWYPPQWLVLILPPTPLLNLLIYAHLAWLGLGMAAWARDEGLHPTAAAFAILAWGLNPKLIAHLGAGHLDIAYALAWVPWLLWAAGRLAKNPTWKRSILFGAAAALLALADLRITFYILPVAAAYGVLKAAQIPGDARHSDAIPLWAAWGGSAALFFLLTAVQVVPLAAIGPSLTRALITPQDAAAYSLPASYLAGLVFPDVGGFHEYMTHLGLPVIAAAPLTLFRREGWPEKAFWWAVGIIGALWALGENGPLFGPALRLIPAVSWFRVPSRAWLVTALALAILGARGLDALLRGHSGVFQRLYGALIGLAGLVWLIGIGWAARIGLVTGELSVPVGVGCVLGITGAGLWLAADGLGAAVKTLPEATVERLIQTGGLIAAAALLVSLALVDRTLIEARSLAVITAEDDLILDALGPEPGLVYSPSFDLIGLAAARAGIDTLGGVDPFQLRTQAEAIAEAAGLELTAYSVTAPPLPLDSPDPIVARFPLAGERLELHERIGDDIYIYRLEGAAEYQETAGGASAADLLGLGISGVTLLGLAAWAFRRWLGARADG
ncbi:MAG: hypothetical protein P8Z40_13385 [Chloroflexota bacterium]